MDKLDSDSGFLPPSGCDADEQLRTAFGAFDAAVSLLVKGRTKRAIQTFAEAFVLANEIPTL